MRNRAQLVQARRHARQVQAGSRPRNKTRTRLSRRELNEYGVDVSLRQGSWVRPRRAQLAGAVGTWMGLVFALCYLAIPAATEAAGLHPGATAGLAGNLAGFAVTLAATLGLVVALRPRIHIPEQGLDPDPVMAATAGGLAVWAVAHNTVPGLMPFTYMPATVLATFVAANVIESGLFGMMLASFTKSRLRAFALGAAFQGLFLGAVCHYFGFW